MRCYRPLCTRNHSLVVPDLIGLRLAPATRKSYEAGWRHWESWCRHVKPPLGPVFRATDDPVLIEDVILSFIITEVSFHGNGWGAASTKLNSICDYHLRHFNLSLRDHFHRVPLVQETLAAEAKRLRTPKLPVRMPMLKYLRSTFTLDIFEHALAWAAIVIAFFGQLRVGQYATASAPDTDAHARVFRDGDIVLFDTHEDLVRWDTCSPAVLDTATEFGFVLRSGKTDQTGDGAVKTIGRSGTDVCVVQAIQALIMARRHVRIEYSSEQLFLRRPYQPGKKRGKLPASFSPKEVANVLKSAAVARGEAPNNFGTHSCRSGGRRDARVRRKHRKVHPQVELNAMRVERLVAHVRRHATRPQREELRGTARVKCAEERLQQPLALFVRVPRATGAAKVGHRLLQGLAHRLGLECSQRLAVGHDRDEHEGATSGAVQRTSASWSRARACTCRCGQRLRHRAPSVGRISASMSGASLAAPSTVARGARVVPLTAAAHQRHLKRERQGWSLPVAAAPPARAIAPQAT